MAEENTQSRKNQLKVKIDAGFNRIGKLTKVQRLLICIATLALVGGSYYYFVFLPKSDALKKARSELKTQEQRLVSYKRQAKALAEFEKQMEEVQEEFNIAMGALPDRKELPSLLTGISRAGSNAGLEFLLFQPAPIVNKEFYIEIPLSMTVRGGYHQLADFFYQVAGLNRIVNINDMSMSVEAGTGGNIQMQCSAVTYMFAESQEDKGKKKK